MLVVFGLLAGCTGGKPISDECVRLEHAIGDVAPPVTVDEVWDALATYAPSSVVWERSPTEDSSSLSVSLASGSEAESTIEYGEGCARQGLATYVPVSFAAVVGDHDVEATIDGGVEAFSNAMSDFLFPEITRGTATLSEEWLSAAESDTAAEMPATPEEWKVSLGGTLADGILSVNGYTGEDNGSYWRGTIQ